ncbi:MAG: xanthine phosphoribosyltransferase, partial [Clostridia bacterium]|nr:xanthine phosphoribosyltransferase [Clostridia bacterium]
VDSFLNHRIDVDLYNAMGQAFYDRFRDVGITTVLTVEASGIGLACVTAAFFHVPVLFAKKGQTSNLGADDLYQTPIHSYTHDCDYVIRVSKRYLHASDRVLIVDDFLANGEAVFGLKRLVEQAGATLCGVGIAIEKGFQDGGRMLRENGVELCSLAVIDSMENGQITFR